MFRNVAIAAAFAVAGTSPAWSHGDYDWINKGGYRNAGGEACCGTIDCEEIPKSRVEETKAGFVLLDKKETVPHTEAVPSEDGKYWRCHRGDGTRRCFFYPLAGF